MAARRIAEDDIRFLYKIEDSGAPFVYKEHSSIIGNDNAFVMATHIHPTAEILAVTKGKITLSTSGGRTEYIGEGEAALLFPYQPHGYSREEGTECFRFNFSPYFAKSFFKSNENSIGQSAVFRPDGDDISPFFDKLRKKANLPAYKVKGFLYSLLSDFLTQVPLVARGGDDNILTRAIFYMDENKKEPLTVGDVAGAMGYNEKYLSRCINKFSGMSFNTLLATLRMDDAKTMLIESDKTILDIAIDCGFGTERSFYRHFGALVGMSPNEYRKRNNRPAKVSNDILVGTETLLAANLKLDKK